MLKDKIAGWLLALFFLTTTLDCLAQKDSTVLFFTGKNVIVLTVPVTNNNTATVVSRAADSTGNYHQLAVLKKAQNLDAFKKITGNVFTDSLKKQLNLYDDNSLWQYISTHDTLRGYGFLALSIRFLQAMGDVYVDESTQSMAPGTKLFYQVKKQGAVTAVVSGTVPDLLTLKPFVKTVLQDDSLIRIKWAYAFDSTEKNLVAYANVYRTKTNGAFELMPGKTKGTRVRDSVQYVFSDNSVVPGNWYSYYLQPVDALGKLIGVNSDTVTAFSKNKSYMPALQNVKAVDTTTGILLTWSKQVSNPYAGGVQVERANASNGPYTVIDTAGKNDTAYLDVKVEQASAYYYRLAAVTSEKNKAHQPITYTGFATAMHMDRKDAPDVPYNFHLIDVQQGLKFAWRPVKSNSLQGYFVYRAVTGDTSGMQLVSHLLNDTTFIDTTKNASRRLDYYYTVRAVNVTGRQSGYSNVVQAKLRDGIDRPLTPAYVNVTRKNNILLIEWQDTKKKDDYVTGYMVYRVKKQGHENILFDVAKPASAEAKRLGFMLLTAKPIKHPYYIDSVSMPDTGYAYTVAVIDISQGESGLAALAEEPMQGQVFIAPPPKLITRNIGKAIELTWIRGDTTGVAGYNIYRKAQGEKGFKKIASINHPAGMYTDGNVTATTIYLYKIKAYSSNGESTAYASASAKTE